MKKAHINVQISGIKDSLMHLEATKPGHAGTLFVTWCRVSDNRYHYGWQFMSGNKIQAADTSAQPVTHEELGRNVEALINNTFIDNTFQHVDQADYLLTD